jgi:hypothetical protein
MLSKEPTKRPTIEQLFNHPFLTGQKVARMVGEVYNIKILFNLF